MSRPTYRKTSEISSQTKERGKSTTSDGHKESRTGEEVEVSVVGTSKVSNEKKVSVEKETGSGKQREGEDRVPVIRM